MIASSSTIRHYVPEQDLSALSRLLTEIESIDRDGEDTSEEYLRASLAWPNYRPAHDVWVAELEGRLMGYGVAFERPSRQCTIYVVVHPLQRRKGLGSQLLELALHRAREVGSETILVYANERNSDSNLFLSHHNFQHVGASGSMKLGAEAEEPRVEFAQGFVLEKYSDVNDPLLLLQALNECYLGMWGHGYNENPTEEEQRSPRFLQYYNADDILLLFDEKHSISGICSLKPYGKQNGTGEIGDLLDGPGIVQKYRERGYQRAMVLAGIEQLRKKGIRPITLDFWGDHESVLNIYRSLGFRMVNKYNAYHRELT